MGTRNNAERYAHGAKTEVAIARTRAVVATVGSDLRRDAIPAQVSARVPGAALFVIDPAEGAGERPAPEETVVCDLDAHAVPGTPGVDGSPASHAGFHAAIYRDAAGVGGVVSIADGAARRVSEAASLTSPDDHLRFVTGPAGTAVAAETLDAAATAVRRIIGAADDA